MTGVLERLRDQPAPFLPMLHAAQERDGRLTEAALGEVADLLRLPRVDVWAAASFYHYFRTAPGPPEARPCDGPACALKGAADGPGTPACPGRCDAPRPPVFRDGAWPAGLAPLPPATGGPEFLFRRLRDGRPGPGDYAAAANARRAPEAALEALRGSGLDGRGGAGYPAWKKWAAVRAAAGGPKVVVCNADEGEPGCFKDRVLLDRDPHAVLEGMAAAGAVVGAAYGIVYLRYEYAQTAAGLEAAIAEAAGPLAGFPIHVRRGAGAYICGEETALLNSLEGRRPVPRARPPFPTEKGLFGAPTLVQNVETLAAVPWILGRGERVTTRIFSVSGDVLRPGAYELPVGVPLRELLRLAGAGSPKGVSLAGVSGGFLGARDFDVRLEPEAVRKAGGMLGAGGGIVYGEARCMVRAAHDVLRFFAHESCGNCFPCRIGTARAEEIFADLAGLRPRAGVEADLSELGRLLEASACGLGLSVPAPIRSVMKYWPDELRAHLAGRCPAGVCGRAAC